MKVEKIGFDQTHSFSRLFLDYVSGKDNLKGFYAAPPTIQGFGEVLKKRQFSIAKRQELVSVLESQYADLDISEQIQANIQSLKSENTYTVTTGHQLNIFTGPLYFIYKIATVVNAARALKKAYPDCNFVPVYWMATEDHDFEEISYFYLDGHKHHWETDQKGPVGRFHTEHLRTLLDTLPEKTPFFPKAYGAFDQLADACRCYVSEIFAEEGVVVIDGDDRSLKTLYANIIEGEVLQPIGKKLVSETNDKLVSEGYSSQAFTRDINFFHLGENYRERIVKNENGTFSINGTGRSFTSEELRAEIASHPEDFSPNVIMRPIYQEVILPNLGYVGGPAEMAYWLQLKSLFDHYEVSFPVLLPRNFAMYIPRNTSRKIERNDLSSADLFLDELALKRKKLQDVGTDHSLNGKIEAFNRVWQEVEEHAANIDPTLRENSLAEKARILKRIAHLEGKMRKAVERHNEDAMRQIEEIKAVLFPGGVPQERRDNFLTYYFSNPSIIQEILQSFDPFDLRFHLLWEE